MRFCRLCSMLPLLSYEGNHLEVWLCILFLFLESGLQPLQLLATHSFLAKKTAGAEPCG